MFSLIGEAAPRNTLMLTQNKKNKTGNDCGTRGDTETQFGFMYRKFKATSQKGEALTAKATEGQCCGCSKETERETPHLLSLPYSHVTYWGLKRLSWPKLKCHKFKQYFCKSKMGYIPDAKPVSVTTSHPDHASYKLFVISQADSFFLLLICRNKYYFVHYTPSDWDKNIWKQWALLLSYEKCGHWNLPCSHPNLSSAAWDKMPEDRCS